MPIFCPFIFRVIEKAIVKLEAAFAIHYISYGNLYSTAMGEMPFFLEYIVVFYLTYLTNMHYISLFALAAKMLRAIFKVSF